MFAFKTEMTQALETRFEIDTFSTAAYLDRITAIDHNLHKYFNHALHVEKSLTRQIVSFQANKIRNAHRWYKYKEAFSADLVEYLLRRYNIPKGKILDPFAGSGKPLIAAND